MFRYRQAKPTMAYRRVFRPANAHGVLTLRSFIPARDVRSVSTATSPHAVGLLGHLDRFFIEGSACLKPVTADSPRLLGLVIAGNSASERIDIGPAATALGFPQTA
jgi:hypothetical protein